MSYEITGNLIEKYPMQQITDSFTKREFVLEKTENGFTEQIKFQLTQDRCDLIERIEKGSEIKVSFNIKGRRWEKDNKVNYFNNLEAWRVAEMNTAGNTATQNESEPPF